MSFEWILSLDDRFSRPAQKARRSALSLSRALDRVGRSARQNRQAFEGLARVSGRWSAMADKAVRLQNRQTASLARMTPALKKTAGAFREFNRRQEESLVGGAGSQKKGGGLSGKLSAIPKGSGVAAAALAAVSVSAAGFAIAAKQVFDGFMLMSRGAASASKWALAQLQFKESNIAGLETLLGSEQAAQDVFKQAIQLANRTPFSSGTVVKGFRKLIGAGFKTEELTSVFQAIGDVAAINDFDEQIIDRIGTAFAQIIGKGKFLTEELRQVVEAGGGVVGYRTVYEEIAKSIGVGVEDVQRAMERGEVTAKTGINAILKVIQKGAGGKVGAGMLRQSNTLGGLLSTLRDAPASMIYSMDLNNSVGFNAVKGTVQNLIKLLDTTSETGKRVQAQLLGMFDTLWSKLFGDFSGESGLQNLEGVVGKIVETSKSLWNIFLGGVELARGAAKGFLDGLGLSVVKMGNAENLRRAGESIGSSLATIAKASIWFAGKLEAAASMFGQLSAWWNDDGGDRKGTGRTVIDDVASFTIDSFLPEPIAAWLRDKEWEHRQAARRGETAHAEGGIVNRPTRALIGESGPEAIIPLSRSHGEGLSHLRGGLGGGMSVTVNLALDARGNDDEADLARRIAALLPSALTDALEGLAIETEGAI